MSEARLSRRSGFLLCAAVLALAIAALLPDTLFGDKILSQADALEVFPPWSDARAAAGEPLAEPQNLVLLDQSIVMQPWLEFGSERVRAGTPPLWNPSNYLGQPMVGTYQTAYFWPLHWVHFLWPSERFWAWSAALRLFAMGALTFALLRTLRFGALPATLGALVYALSGFSIAWLGHMHTHVSLFLPALLLFVERIARRPGRASDVVGLALCTAGALLAGHLQTAVHVALAVAAWTAFRALVALPGAEGAPRLGAHGLGRIAAAALAGVLLAMPQLLPFFDYLAGSSGEVVLEELQTVDPIDPLDAAVLMVDPGHFGSPAAAQGFGPYTGPEGQNVNYNELVGGFVGRLALVLALLGLALCCVPRRAPPGRRRVLAFFGALGLVAAAVAWQVPPFYELAEAIPKLTSTKLMRLAVVLTLALAVLAAAGLEALLERLPRRAAGPIGLALVALVGAELVAFGRGYNPAIDPARKAPATAVTDFLQAQLPADGSLPTWRVLGLENTMLLPSANLFYGLPMVTGYDSMEARTTTELVALMSSSPAATGFEGGPAFIATIPYFDQSWSVANLLGVRYVLSRIPLPPPLELRLDGPTQVYENRHALRRAFSPGAVRVIEDPATRLAFLASPEFDPGGIAVLESAADGLPSGAHIASAVEPVLLTYTDLEVEVHMDVRASSQAPGGAEQAALLVLADAWDDGWVADIDGEPVKIVRVNHGLRGVWVPLGEHLVTFRYRPASVVIGVQVAIWTLVIGLVWLVRSRTRNRAAAS